MPCIPSGLNNSFKWFLGLETNDSKHKRLIIMGINIPCKLGHIIQRFRITFTANARNDHVIMFTLSLPLAVVQLGSFALASKARIILHYSRLCTKNFCFSRKHKHDSHVRRFP